MANQRIGDDQVARLDELLEACADEHGGMTLEMLDGFLSALVVGPDLVPPSEYLPCIWTEELVWESAEEAEEALGLVMALWNDITRRVCAPLPDEDMAEEAAFALLEASTPLLAMPEDLDLLDPQVVEQNAELPLAASWANGFLAGISLRRDAWDAWADEDDEVAEDIEDLVRMSLFNAEHAGELELDAEDVPALADRLGFIAEIPFMLHDLNWKRLERMRPQPVRRPDLPGRNDPCLCGSGLKFKKCCGAPGKLN